MNEAEIRKKILENQAQYEGANDATKALLMAKNEGLAKQLDTLTGGQSTYDATSGRWALSGDSRDAVDRYLQQRDLVAGGAYGGYDASSDPAYSALKKSILRESDRSVEDTMGAYAGMTGGIPSTAAVTAAQETANYFRGQLADQQVALGEQDYNRWQNDRKAAMDLMDIYASEAEASAANLAALGDFSAMGKLYGWNEAQIAEAQRLWLAEQGGSGGGGRSNSLQIPDNAGLFPQGVVSALGYGDGGKKDGTVVATKKGAVSSGAVDEAAVYSKVQNIVRNLRPEQAWAVINNGTTFTGAEKDAATQMYKELFS